MADDDRAGGDGDAPRGPATARPAGPRGLFLRRRSALCLLVAFSSWLALIVYQAYKLRPNAVMDGLNEMMQSTVIINLVVFLFPLSYLLLVWGLGRKYDTLETLPKWWEAAIGFAICALSFFLGPVTRLVVPTSGQYGVTDYLVFLIGVSYLFFGYHRLRGLPLRIKALFYPGPALPGDAGNEKRRLARNGLWLSVLGFSLIFTAVFTEYTYSYLQEHPDAAQKVVVPLHQALSLPFAWLLVVICGIALFAYGLYLIDRVLRGGTPGNSRAIAFMRLIKSVDVSIWFVAVMGFIYAIYQTKYFEGQLIRNLEPFESNFVAAALHAFGYPVTSNGNMMYVNGLHGFSAFTIDVGCTGIVSMTVYSVLGSALILTVPSKLWKKAVCIFSGVFLLFFANLLRLMTIDLIAYYKDQRAAMEFHTYGGYIYFLIFVGIFWFVSLNYFLIEPRKRGAAGEECKDKEGKGSAPDGPGTKEPPRNQEETAASGVKKFTIDVSWVFAAMMVSMVVGFVLKVMLGNAYGPADLGLYSLVLVIYMIAYTVGELGVSATVTKFVSQHKGDPGKVVRYSSVAFFNALIYSSILAVIFYLLAGPIAGAYGHPELKGMLQLVSPIFPLLAMNNAIIGSFNGLRQMHKYGACSIFRRVIVVFYTAAAIWMGAGIEGAVVALVLAEASNFVLAVYQGRGMIFPQSRRDFSAVTREIWGFSWAVVLLNVISQTEYRIDLLILAFFVSAHDVGVYSVAVMFAWFLPMVPRAMQSITFPMISSYNAKGQKDKMERLVNKSLKFSLLLLTLMALGLIFLGQTLVSWFFNDSSFSQAYVPMVILTVGLVVYGMLTAVGSALLGIGKPQESLKISVAVTLPVSLGLCFVLIPGIPGILPAYGMSGAAAAISVSYILTSVAYLVVLRRHSGIRIFWGDICKIMACGLLSAGTILLISPFAGPLVSFGAGAAIFAMLVYALKIVTDEEIKAAKGIVGR